MPPNAGDARDMDLIAGLGRSPGGGNRSHSSTLAGVISWTEEACQAIVHGVTKSQTQLKG